MTDFQAALVAAIVLPVIAGVLFAYWGYRLLWKVKPQRMDAEGTFRELSIALKRAPVGSVLALFGAGVVVMTVLNIDVTYRNSGWRIAQDPTRSNVDAAALAAYLSPDFVNDQFTFDSLSSGGLMLASVVRHDGFYSVQGDYALSVAGDSIRLDTLQIPVEITSEWQSFLNSRGVFSIDDLTFLNFEWQEPALSAQLH